MSTIFLIVEQISARMKSLLMDCLGGNNGHIFGTYPFAKITAFRSVYFSVHYIAS